MLKYFVFSNSCNRFSSVKNSRKLKMSETEIQSVVTPDFSRKLTLLGEGEQKKQATLLDYIRPFGESDSKSNTGAYSARENFKYEKCGFGGDAKPPQRLLNTPLPKRGQELADDIAERIHKTTLKRDQLINDIVERCRLYNDKVSRTREKLAARRVQTCEKVEKELEDRRSAAEKSREEIFHNKMERIRKHMEHAKVVRNRKSLDKGMSGDTSDTCLRNVASNDNDKGDNCSALKSTLGVKLTADSR